MTSSRKFSYWSSPTMSNASGAKRSRSLRSRWNPSTRAARCRPAAASPSSSAHSARIGSGQPSGRRSSSGMSGSSRVQRKAAESPPSGWQSGGKWVSPMPSTDPTRPSPIGIAAGLAGRRRRRPIASALLIRSSTHLSCQVVRRTVSRAQMRSAAGRRRTPPEPFGRRGRAAETGGVDPDNDALTRDDRGTNSVRPRAAAAEWAARISTGDYSHREASFTRSSNHLELATSHRGMA